MILFDFLQVCVLARILDVHLHSSVVIHLWRWLMIELELRPFTADLSPLVSSCLCHLSEDNTAGTSTFFGYIKPSSYNALFLEINIISLLTGNEIVFE